MQSLKQRLKVLKQNSYMEVYFLANKNLTLNYLITLIGLIIFLLMYLWFTKVQLNINGQTFKLLSSLVLTFQKNCFLYSRPAFLVNPLILTIPLSRSKISFIIFNVVVPAPFPPTKPY